MSNSPEVEPGAERALRSSTRNPRRRPRQTDTESLKVAPRRKRSKISEETFVPPRHDEEEEANGVAAAPAVNGEAQTGSAGRGRGRPRKESGPVLDLEIPLRSKRSSVKRPTRGDGAMTLTQNARYSLKLLPSTPRDLRKEGVEWRGRVGAAHLAVAVTRARAYIWDYTAHSPVANPRVFELPFAVKSIDPLPFGALVSNGTSTETGLVLVSATTGKVIYYESIERAASLGLFQERNIGVEGTLGNLFSGETVVDIISAHHAGFILILSSGRIAQLTLRDAQGKAQISAQFLRATEQSSSGLFGSIKGLLGAGAWKRDVAAVQTRQLGPRGQMQVISLTERAELQSWDLDWNGQYTFKGTLDFREVITQELRKLGAPEFRGKYDALKALDFAIVERIRSQSNEIATVATGLALDALVLLQVGRADDCEHVIAGVVIEGQDVAVPQLLQLHLSHHPTSKNSTGKPRLLLPQPGHTAIAVFEDAIVVKELDRSEANSPEAQLHASYIQPTTFEDAVYLRHDTALAVVEACEEGERSGNESALAFVNGAGIVRLNIASPKSVEREATIPIKNKIEQAVFHGALQDGNILDFSRDTEGAYSPDEIEAAALAISDEILRSTSPFISASPTSMESHLTYKAQALRALINHVRQKYPTLSKSAMWQLLWDTEKVAAAQQLWKMFEEHVAAYDQTKRIATVMNDVCTLANQDIGGDLETSTGDDAVRTFLVHKLHRLDKLLTWTEMFIRDLKTDSERSASTKLRLLREANDLWNQALETVFNFRIENVATYGILPDLVEDGVLIDVVEYTDLPEFWTSTASMLKAVVRMAELSRQIVHQEFEKTGDDEVPVIEDIRAHNPRLLESMCRIYQERINWLASRHNEKDRELAKHLRLTYIEARHNHLRELADIAQSEAGMRLAEKYRDFSTLTEMVVAEMQFSIDSLLTTPQNEQSQIMQYIAKITARVSTYFERYGEEWATAYFQVGFSGSQAGVMLRDAQVNWQESLTKYLRAEPSRAKICWINDVTTYKDFEHASESLIIAARDQETKLWEKKVELSLGKLSVLATQEDLNANGATMTGAELERALPNEELEVVNLQEKLYQHLLPEIRHCIDQQAELEVAMQKFAFKNQDLHALRQLLESYLDRVLQQIVLSAYELIDVLTLVDNIISEIADPRNFQGSEFFLALKLLNALAPRIPQDRFETLLQLIWKRCYVYDDWFDINGGGQQKHMDNVAREKMKETAAWRTLFHAFDQGFLDAPRCHVRVLPPSECLGAGCRPEDLAFRWHDADILDPIVMDNKIQDEQLQSYVDDRRLDEWIAACVDDVKETLERKAEEKARRLERERAFAASMHEAEAEAGGRKVNGHAPNGVMKGGHPDEEGDFLGADVDGDIDMA